MLNIRKNYYSTIFLILTFTACLAFGLGFYFFSLEINSLQAEKNYWGGVLSSETIPEKSTEIPTADNLPKIIELCQDCLAKNEIVITSFNVERFSGVKEPANSGDLDYAGLRIHFLGKWPEIETGLNELEHMNKQAIHIQEVILTPEGGEALLQIYLLNN